MWAEHQGIQQPCERTVVQCSCRDVSGKNKQTSIFRWLVYFTLNLYCCEVSYLKVRALARKLWHSKSWMRAYKRIWKTLNIFTLWPLLSLSCQQRQVLLLIVGDYSPLNWGPWERFLCKDMLCLMLQPCLYYLSTNLQQESDSDILQGRVAINTSSRGESLKLTWLQVPANLLWWQLKQSLPEYHLRSLDYKTSNNDHWSTLTKYLVM